MNSLLINFDFYKLSTNIYNLAHNVLSIDSGQDP